MLTAPTAAKRSSWTGQVAPAARSAAAPAQRGQRQRAAGQRPAEPGDAAQVGQRRGHDVDPAVGVVHPVDRHLVDTQSGPLGDHQQLGVEEPPGVLHQRQQPLGDVAPDALKPHCASENPTARVPRSRAL